MQELKNNVATTVATTKNQDHCFRFSPGTMMRREPGKKKYSQLIRGGDMILADFC
jgi:hypothetical protein